MPSTISGPDQDRARASDIARWRSALKGVPADELAASIALALQEDAEASTSMNLEKPVVTFVDYPPGAWEGVSPHRRQHGPVTVQDADGLYISVCPDENTASLGLVQNQNWHNFGHKLGSERVVESVAYPGLPAAESREWIATNESGHLTRNLRTIRAVQVGNILIQGVATVSVVHPPRLADNDADQVESLEGEGLLILGGSNGFLYALEARTGHLHWRYAVRPQTIVSHEHRLYVTDDSGALLALDEHAGALIWRLDNGPQSFAPIAVDALGIMITAPTEGEPSLVAVDIDSGREVWKRALPGPVTAWQITPFGVVVATSDIQLISPASGELRWAKVTDASISQLQLVANVLICATKDRELYGFDIVTGETRWMNPELTHVTWIAPTEAHTATHSQAPVTFLARTPTQINLVDVGTGETRWSALTQHVSPLVHATRDLVILERLQSQVCARDITTGAVTWNRGDEVEKVYIPAHGGPGRRTVQIRSHRMLGCDDEYTWLMSGTDGIRADFKMHALDTNTGNTVWSIPSTASILGSIQLIEARSTLFLGELHQVRSINKRTGSENWRFELEAFQGTPMWHLPDGVSTMWSEERSLPTGIEATDYVTALTASQRAREQMDRGLDALMKVLVRPPTARLSHVAPTNVDPDVSPRSDPDGDTGTLGATLSAKLGEAIPVEIDQEIDDEDEFAEEDNDDVDEEDHEIGAVAWRDSVFDAADELGLTTPCADVLDVLEELDPEEVGFDGDPSELREPARDFIQSLLSDRTYDFESACMEWLSDMGVSVDSEQWEGGAVSGTTYTFYHSNPHELDRQMAESRNEALDWLRKQTLNPVEDDDDE